MTVEPELPSQASSEQCKGVDESAAASAQAAELSV